MASKYDMPSFDLGISQTQSGNVNKNAEGPSSAPKVAVTEAGTPVRLVTENEEFLERCSKFRLDRNVEELEEGGMKDAETEEAEGSEDYIRMNAATCRADVKFQSCTDSTIRKSIKDVLTAEEYSTFLETCFGIYMRPIDYSHQGVLHRCIREFQVQAPDDTRIWIFVDGKLLKFSITEFVILTGFRIDSREEDFVFPPHRAPTFMTRYFHGRKTVKKSMVIEEFEGRAFRDDHNDAVNMAILVFICSFILSMTGDSKIDTKYFHLVESGRYAQYPWGRVAFRALMEDYSKPLPPGNRQNMLHGFPYALQLWIYECCAALPEGVAVLKGENDQSIPRILNWDQVNKKLLYKHCRRDLFEGCYFENIFPTANEISTFSLERVYRHRPSEGAGPSRLSTIAAGGERVDAPTRLVEPRVIEDDDFADEQPQLVRRSLRQARQEERAAKRQRTELPAEASLGNGSGSPEVAPVDGINVENREAERGGTDAENPIEDDAYVGPPPKANLDAYEGDAEMNDEQVDAHVGGEEVAHEMDAEQPASLVDADIGQVSKDLEQPPPNLAMEVVKVAAHVAVDAEQVHACGDVGAEPEPDRIDAGAEFAAANVAVEAAAAAEAKKDDGMKMYTRRKRLEAPGISQPIVVSGMSNPIPVLSLEQIREIIRNVVAEVNRDVRSGEGEADVENVIEPIIEIPDQNLQTEALDTEIPHSAGGSQVNQSDAPSMASVQVFFKKELRRCNKELEDKMDDHYTKLRELVKKKFKLMEESFTKKMTKLEQALAKESEGNSSEPQPEANQDANVEPAVAEGSDHYTDVSGDREVL